MKLFFWSFLKYPFWSTLFGVLRVSLLKYTFLRVLDYILGLYDGFPIENSNTAQLFRSLPGKRSYIRLSNNTFIECITPSLYLYMVLPIHPGLVSVVLQTYPHPLGHSHLLSPPPRGPNPYLPPTTLPAFQGTDVYSAQGHFSQLDLKGLFIG